MICKVQTPLEKVLVSRHKPDMIAYVKANASSFADLVQFSIADNPPYSWRAAWLIRDYIQPNDSRIQKHVAALIQELPERNDSQNREVLKLLELMDIEEEQEGFLFSHCLYLWEQLDKQPSVRFTAFKMMLKIAYKHPDLKGEIKALSQEHYVETLTPGVRQSMRILLRKLK